MSTSLETAPVKEVAVRRTAAWLGLPETGQPIRAELFGREQLVEQARDLAASCHDVYLGRGQPLPSRFADNGKFLRAAHREIAEAYRRQESIGTDAEWLLDNFHVVAEVLREIQVDLPAKYYVELPKLAEGVSRGLPRVYVLALHLIAHTDSSLEEHNLAGYVQAFQSVTPLSIGELWAVPIMLRLGLLENLRRLAEEMLRTWRERRDAEKVAQDLLLPGGGRISERAVARCLAEPFGHHCSDAFIVHLLAKCREHGPGPLPGLEELQRFFQERGTHIDEVVQRENQRQAANQVSVGNCITSLRLLAVLDWKEFFESSSEVESELRRDPAGAYARQDFATRDRYRRAVEQLARRSPRTEVEIAREALALARGSSISPPGSAQNHVGYYLIGPGKPKLESRCGYRPSSGERPQRWLLARPQAAYFGALTLTPVLMTAALVLYAGLNVWTLLIVVLGLFITGDLAVAAFNNLFTLIFPPRVLPKLDFKDGIPAECATFVVMPTMLLRPQSASALLERLEVHYLSNPDPQLWFALLTDFADAPQEHMPEDAGYLQAAMEGVQALNAKYAAGGPDRFYVFHRRRLWDASEGCWMGWERKRGKLLEFNRLLRGARDTSFTACSGDLERLPRIRYVITLDADTRLPRETAHRLVGTLDHPLNQPRFDPGQGRVVEGYGVLQPRVSLHLSGATTSLFSRIYARSAGLDPYTTAVSDVYQDLFGLGSFTGKGIFAVEAFEEAIGGAFPENHILSHDLIEGNFARCGLATDIELLDEFPARYHVFARREHRWVRGDWQILPWLFPKVPSGGRAGPTWVPNPLPLVERWKIFDNLRRSLVPPALVLFLICGWLVFPGSPWFWTAWVLAVLWMPLALQGCGVVWTALRGRRWAPLREFYRDLPYTAAQCLLSMVFLADRAWTNADAIVRTLWRMSVSRRHLLEWETAASTERRLGLQWNDFLALMWSSPATSIALALVVEGLRPWAFTAASSFLLSWLVSPAVAYWLSQPPVQRASPLTAEERQKLRRLARKTWLFFETFVGDEDHWLPPDNYQEDPKGQVAHRTSPTNQGLLLLSTLAAHDLGYLSLPRMLERLQKTFATFDRLERVHGHFLNWYDTRTLKALQPAYISTVDSGNLLGCLLALKQGLREKAEEVQPRPAWRDGLRDTARLLAEAIRNLEPGQSATPSRNGHRAWADTAGSEPDDLFRTMNDELDSLHRRLEELPSDLPAWDLWLGSIEEQAAKLSAQVRALGQAVRETPDSAQAWADRLASQASDRRAELAQLAPWLSCLRQAPDEASSLPEPLRQQWSRIRQALVAPVSMADVHEARTETLRFLETAARLDSAGNYWSDLAVAFQACKAADWLAVSQELADRATAFAAQMDFKVLYNEQRSLFAVGYNLTLNRLDNSYYDLLASEARLASFLAIARGDVPKKHWFQLGRPLTRASGHTVLISWGGTMFEYLMPQLLLRSYPDTILEEACRGAVARQMEYGRQGHVPWGISESGYAALDGALDYQYQSFGVPGLGLKRGLARDLVIAPYATALSLLVQPHEAVRNFSALTRERGEGSYGYYEAIDYTRDRLLKKRRSWVVRSYMAHHQGMSLLAVTNCLLDKPMQRRLHQEPMVRATELLLQERMPRSAPLLQANPDESDGPPPPPPKKHLPMSRRLTSSQTPAPRTHLLSNGRYTVMITNGGSGFSTCQGLDVTRWREDRTRDHWGQFCYIRDLRSGLRWSAGHHPLCRIADEYEVVFSADKAEIRRLDAGIETHLEIAVSPEHLAEVRRLTLTNHNLRAHELEITSFAEIVLNPHGADLAHPAFGKLFLETEFVPGSSALLCRRRPRSEEQKPIWAMHAVAVEGQVIGDLEYETDRSRFLGRNRSEANPQALDPDRQLSATTGPVLDPVFSLRRRIKVGPKESAVLSFTTAVADSREEAVALANQYHDPHGIARTFDLAWAHSQVEMRHLRIPPEDVHVFQRLASSVLYACSQLRADARVLAANRQGQPGLWRHGISGDLPIALVRFREPQDLQLVEQALSAHSYWRLKGLIVDLVLLNEHAGGYFDELHREVQSLVRSSTPPELEDKPGGVFIRKGEQLSEDDKVLLLSAARVVLDAAQGSLSNQVDRGEPQPVLPPRFVPTGSPREVPRNRPSAPAKLDLRFDNGYGGFSGDGQEYVVTVRAGDKSQPRPTPAPWINVIANSNCGFLISESGGGYTWAGNSQLNRLTPWCNDPVSDPPGELIYLRDEASGMVWNVPHRHLKTGWRRCRHGLGYTIFEQQCNDLGQELVLFVPPSDPVKIFRLRVRNDGPAVRRLAVAFYAEWVLGTVRDQAPMQVITEVDGPSGAILARNPFNTDFGAKVAFADVNLRPRTITGDRTEFIGRNGTACDAVAHPVGLSRIELSGRVGAALDPCAALLAKLELAPGEQNEVTFFLGQAGSVEEVRVLVQRYREPVAVQAALDEAVGFWKSLVGTIQVRTPDPQFDILLNGWLLYQVLSCRVWGRSAFYQSGGAYGFRDQLQDVMALVYGAPDETRDHILRAARRQFLEGDVQHWWHPPAGRGVRTRISDDFLWLPLVVCHYVRTTGDAAILDEQLPFLKAPLLQPEQEETYGVPEVTTETASVYEHCMRAIEHGCRFGAHGLPLMGTGDWNDGMNRVGAGGQGESVWNAWFLITILRDFADLAEARSADGGRYRELAERLHQAVEKEAWDGRWYRRAYYDDGSPLGSAQNDECQIDAIAQSWAAFAGVAEPERVRQALDAVDELLVRRDPGMILLFTPPFDHGRQHPGYIKGYVPGIRENGGQYTHAATWVVQAAALLGQGTRALEYFRMLNPIRHASTTADANRYRVEPYVVVADVYGHPPHVGRGGWTWYTGSAGWLYRVGLEAILGFHLRGNRLYVEPCIDAAWKNFEVTYRHRTATYHIHIDNPDGVEKGVRRVEVDGSVAANGAIELHDDGQTHEVRIVLGR